LTASLSSPRKWGFGSQVEPAGSLECGLCEAAITAVQHVLENSTRIDSALENFLESQVCTRLPTSVQQLCNSTVSDQLPEILASLADRFLDGPTDCIMLHACSNSSNSSSAVGESKFGSVGCDICNLITAYVNSTLFRANNTVAFIEKELDSVCSLLPAEYATVCATAAQVAAPELLNFIGDWIATNACIEIKLCPAPAHSHHRFLTQ